MRVELRDGQWAELRERLAYGQARDVRRASVAIRLDPLAVADFDLAIVRAYVSGWNVLAIDGSAVPLDTPEGAPDDVIQAIAERGLGLWNEAPDPKGTPATSASSS